MKTQISRDSHRPDQRYSGLYQQQGRMITDADWNELVDLVKERMKRALADIVVSGVPDAGGLAITKPGADVQITPGRLYADGVAGELSADAAFGLDGQYDLPGYPTPTPGDAYLLYADVWDLSVTYLQDEALRDPALHGADTCTRSQRLVQIKSCPAGIDPEMPSQNPRKGDAPLTLELRAAHTTQDPCDPCALETGVAEGSVGNYLFRLEVHDVAWNVNDPSDAIRLTLKWSTENGAEQYSVVAGDTPPEEFTAGDWIFEFHSDASERHLGVNFVSSAGFPVRGALEAGYPESVPAGFDYVRRWDGYCELQKVGGNWTLVGGRERSAELSTDAGEEADGSVGFTGGLTINLATLALTLELDGKVFVVGDYWLAPVREEIHGEGASVLSGEQPVGIAHHYLKLVEVLADGSLVAPTDAERRRLNFPALTDLHASDIGLTNHCPGLYADAENVQQALDHLCDIDAADIAFANHCPALYADADNVQEALDNLCDIDASDIAYEVPNCQPGAGDPPTIQSLLAALLADWPDLDGDGKTSAKDILDSLLCRLDAARLPYDPNNQTARWQVIREVVDLGTPPRPNTVQQAIDLLADLDASKVPFSNPCPERFPGAQDVQQALQQLCETRADQVSYAPDPGCELSADAGVQTVKDALDALCMRPSGEGGGCRVSVRPGDSLSKVVFGLLEQGQTDICLCLLPGRHDLGEGLELHNEGLHLSITGCDASTTQIVLDQLPFILEVDSFHVGGIELVIGLDANLSITQCREVTLESTRISGLVGEAPLVVLDADEQIRLSGNLIDAYLPEAFDVTRQVLETAGITAEIFAPVTRQRFMRGARKLAVELVKQDQAVRQAQAVKLRAAIKENSDRLSSEERQSLTLLARSIGVDTDRAVVSDLVRARESAATAHAAPAVVIASADAATLFENNEIIGVLSLYGVPGNATLSDEELKVLEEIISNIDFFSTGRNLQMRNNRLSRLVVSAELINAIRLLPQREQPQLLGLFDTLLLTDNQIGQADNQFVGRHHSLSTTRFDQASTARAGFAIGLTGIYVGNFAQLPETRLEHVAHRSPAVAANADLVIT